MFGVLFLRPPPSVLSHCRAAVNQSINRQRPQLSPRPPGRRERGREGSLIPPLLLVSSNCTISRGGCRKPLHRERGERGERSHRQTCLQSEGRGREKGWRKEKTGYKTKNKLQEWKISLPSSAPPKATSPATSHRQRPRTLREYQWVRIKGLHTHNNGAFSTLQRRL